MLNLSLFQKLHQSTMYLNLFGTKKKAIAWNIKPSKQKNVISIFISTGDRSIEIKSAFNLKYIIQDCHIRRIIDKIMIPKFKHQDYATGILLGTKTIIKRVVTT